MPSNVKFHSVSNGGMDVSWECDLSRMSEGYKGNVKCVVEVKKRCEKVRNLGEKCTQGQR